MKTITEKAVAAVKKFASVDKTRVSLARVRVEPGNRTVQAIATDGHRLAVCRLPDNEAIDRKPYLYGDDGEELNGELFPDWKRVRPGGEPTAVLRFDAKALDLAITAWQGKVKHDLRNKLQALTFSKLTKKEFKIRAYELRSAEPRGVVLSVTVGGPVTFDGAPFLPNTVTAPRVDGDVTVAVNAKYLQEAVAFAKHNGLVVVELRDEYTALAVYPMQGKDERYMWVMPMRQQNEKKKK